MEEYYIIFTKGMNGLLDRILGTDLGHIIILKLDGDRMFLINPVTNQCEITSLPNNPGRIINSVDVRHLVYVKCKNVQPKRILSILSPFTCVKFVKYMLGLKMFALTPNQLYKKLRAEAERLFNGNKPKFSNLINAVIYC